MTNKQILATLTARAQGRPDAEDAAQEALTCALTDDRELRGEALLARADEHLAAILVRTRWDNRKGRAVSNVTAHREPVTFEPVRRPQGAKRRLPKGVTSVHAYDSGFHVIPRDEGGDDSDERLRFAATQLLHVDLPRLVHGEPYPSSFGELIVAAYREIYGVEPQFHWAFVLVEEIARAKLQCLRDTHPDAGAAPPSKTEVTLVAVSGPGAQGMGTRAAAESVVIHTVPGRAVRRIFVTIDGVRKRVGTELLTQEPEQFYPLESAARSEMILNVVRLRLAGLAVSQIVPAYADNPILVGWLFARLGFEGGGGLEKVKRATLLAWLCEPEELAAQVDRYARRRARRGTDDEGVFLESQLANLAAAIRTR